MIKTGIVRRIDDLGRIFVPKEIRKKIYGTANRAEGKPMEFFIGDDNTIILKPYQGMKMWTPIADAYGEIVEFICDCGCSNPRASRYCPDCGAEMDNTDIEERIQEAIQESK